MKVGGPPGTLGGVGRGVFGVGGSVRCFTEYEKFYEAADYEDDGELT